MNLGVALLGQVVGRQSPLPLAVHWQRGPLSYNRSNTEVSTARQFVEIYRPLGIKKEVYFMNAAQPTDEVSQMKMTKLGLAL